MEYINGTEAGKKFKCCSSDEKIDFTKQIKENINKMNTKVNEKYPTMDVKDKALLNVRWNALSNEVNDQRKELIEGYNFTNKVYVHGDITGDNVIINQDGTLYILDFADGTIAPKEYEYGPILFDLFDFDKLMIHEFIGGQDAEEFAEKCFYGILIHEFGIYFVKLICERVLGIEASELTDILKLKEALVHLFK